MSKQPYLCLATFALFLAICNASLTTNERDMFLEAHNDARAALGVAPLHWNDEIASYASSLTEHSEVGASCELPQNKSNNEYGLNQVVANLPDMPNMLVGNWVSEGKKYYNYEQNSCESGHQNECDSYTQVVWRATVGLGCAKGNCGRDGSHVVCLYDPAGNVNGQKPY